jgi:hypothetical protein
MRYTGEAAVLVPDSATRWHARREHLSKIIFSVATKRKMHERRKLLVYVPEKHPNTYPLKIS